MNSPRVKRRYPLLFLGLLLIVAAAWSHSHETSITQTIVDIAHWQTYTNTAHHYQVLYPENSYVAPHSEDGSASNQWDDVEIAVPGKKNYWSLTAYVPYNIQAPKSMSEPRAKLISLPLDQFAETIRQTQIHDNNPNMQGREIGDLKPITIAGQLAYSFTLTKGFKEESEPKDDLGYILPGDSVYNFVFLENRTGEKLMIHYPLGDAISERIAQSLEVL